MKTTSSQPEQPHSAWSTKAHSKRQIRRGWLIVMGAMVPIGIWMASAPLAMAVNAPAFVKVDLNRRPVQHLEGGIVQSVLVRDGQFVNEGDPILILGDVSVDADRNRLAYRVNTIAATIARLEAEQALAGELVFPEELLAAAREDSRVQETLEKETTLFNTRRTSFESEVALMKAQRVRIEQEIASLTQQIRHGERSRASQAEELETNRKLLADEFIGETRIVQLEAALSDYSARLEERRSELLRAEQRLGDIDLRIASTQNEFAKQASDQLNVASSQLAEVEQERRKSDDAGVRQTVTAPSSGHILGLKFNSPGGVILPGDTIAEIVPRDAELVEARIRPEDVNNVQVDQRARIQFTAFKYRNTLLVAGTVTYVSADRLVDEATQLPYYSVLIAVDPDSLSEAQGLKMQAGMPAQVYIDGGTQTALQYIIEPITSTWRMAARKL